MIEGRRKIEEILRKVKEKKSKQIKAKQRNERRKFWRDFFDSGRNKKKLNFIRKHLLKHYY